METLKYPKGDCQNCGRKHDDKPMAFKEELYCSDKCRKALGLGPKNRQQGSAGV